MTDAKTYEDFLFDVGLYIKERALDAKGERARALPDSADFHFDDGRLMGLHEAISLLQQTLDGFGIPRKAMQLDDIDPERDLT